MDKYRNYLEKLTEKQIVLYEYEIFRPILLSIIFVKENPKLLQVNKQFKNHIKPFLSNPLYVYKLAEITKILINPGVNNVNDNYLQDVTDKRYYTKSEYEYKQINMAYIKYLLNLNEEEIKKEFEFYEHLIIFTEQMLKLYCYENRRLPILDFIKDRDSILYRAMECRDKETNYWLVLGKEYLETKLREFGL